MLTGNLVSVNLVSVNRKMGNEVSGAAFGNEVERWAGNRKMGNEVSVNEVVPARAYQVAGNRKMGNEVVPAPLSATRLPATERWATRLCRRRIVLTGNLVSVNLVSGNLVSVNLVSGAGGQRGKTRLPATERWATR